VSTGAKRLIALAVAILLIVAGIGVRALIDGGGDNGGGGVSRPLRLLCASELSEACDDLARNHGVEVTVEGAGDTTSQLSRMSDADVRALGYDGWLTLSRDAEIVREARDRASLDPAIGSPLGPIARSPLVLAVWADRAKVLDAHCNGTVDWKCIGRVAGTPWSTIGGDAGWGVVKPGHNDPASTGIGLSVIGQAAAEYFGRTDLSRDDFADDGFLEWFGRVERAVPSGLTAAESPFERMLAAGPAAFDAVGTTEAEAGPLLAQAAPDRRRQVHLLYPAPVTTADVVFAPFAHAAGANDLRDLVTGDDGRAALARAGWRVDGESRARGIPLQPKLPMRSNLPSPGSLEALLDTWHQVTG